MNKKRSYIVIFSLLFILTIGIISIDYSKQLGAILADAADFNPGHSLSEIEEWETLVRTTGNQTIAGVKTFMYGVKINAGLLLYIGDTRVGLYPDSHFFRIDFNEINALSINKYGDVGVGKIPTTKFDVDGKIKATEIDAGKITSTGLVKIGGSNVDCSSSEEGSVKYNQLTKNLEVCNGLSWVAFSQKSCQLNGEPQTTLWGENKYDCSGSDYRCFNGECRACTGTFIDGKCWHSVGVNSPCASKGGLYNNDPYYTDSSDCNVCKTMARASGWLLNFVNINCVGSSNLGPEAVTSRNDHTADANCYYHNSSSDRTNPGLPVRDTCPGNFGLDCSLYFAPCQY